MNILNLFSLSGLYWADTDVYYSTSQNAILEIHF